MTPGNTLRRLARAAARLPRARGGIAAVEFALLLPLLLALYVGLAELARGIQSKRSLGQFARTIADMTGRVAPAEMGPIFDAANFVARPIDPSGIEARLSAVGVYQVGGALRAYVCSSAGNRGSNARAVMEAIVPSSRDGSNFPVNFQVGGARYILAEVNAPFTLMLGNALLKLTGVRTVATLSDVIAWPERGDTEIVLPGGRPCPDKAPG
ncbi:TadE/TadG family type IV pilus assembly protein [Methylobacterium sp. A54F]